MKSLTYAGVISVVLLSLILAGCPSPLQNQSSDISEKEIYTSTARIDPDRLVFVEEDGTEIPLKTESGDGPEEIVDYVVLDDGGVTARSSGATNRIRCVVIGRRSDGRSGIWVIYRYRGMIVLPNEDGIEDSVLMELVEAEDTPWYGEDWVYDAKEVSSDGKIIIGQLSRPDGWKYLSGDIPDPEIGVWWSIYEKENRLIVSRARPMLMMYEPEPEDSIARCHGGGSWIRNWIEMFIEWIQVSILKNAWNYMLDAEYFVYPADIPDGYYVVSGPDKYGVDSQAWLTHSSMEDILEAPDPGDVYRVIGPLTTSLFSNWRVDQYVPLVTEGSPDSDVTFILNYQVTDPTGFVPNSAFLISVVDVDGVPNIKIYSREDVNYTLEIRVDIEDGDGNVTEGLPLILVFEPNS